MEFHFDDDDLIWNISNEKPVHSRFDSLLKNQWEIAAEAGVCRYRLTNLQTKILPGKYGFVAQLNSDRATQRRLPQNLQKVNSPFDGTLFNFNKVPAQEVLLKPGNKAAAAAATSGKIKDNEATDAVVIINVSPLEFGNSLLVPNVTANIPQRITQEGLDLLVRLMLLSTDVNLKAGFNSPGGYASVNHQHYHLYYLRERLYLETAAVEPIAGPCFALTDFPSKGFAFQLTDNDPALLAKNVFTLVSYLCANEIAHNLFVTRGKRFGGTLTTADVYDTLRVFVWAREPAFGVKEEIGFNPALCELAGHLLIKEPPAYQVVTEKEAAQLLDSITAPWFERVGAQIAHLFAFAT
ncbi:GDP-D-glucose phosphorylase 1-like [Daphnia pulex]|uniref:GDP-D-glucose phosphorylase 1-like n=1 Tax=Daphnia pulex TaxID=6669 RepID=UPI001EDF354C|nr:GDP-D-glucose phosphorylase 1-like [Daphnia pulex]